jgi:hypothetical protein
MTCIRAKMLPFALVLQMVLAPNWERTQRLMRPVAVLLPLAATYGLLLWCSWETDTFSLILPGSWEEGIKGKQHTCSATPAAAMVSATCTTGPGSLTTCQVCSLSRGWATFPFCSPTAATTS